MQNLKRLSLYFKKGLDDNLRYLSSPLLFSIILKKSLMKIRAIYQSIRMFDESMIPSSTLDALSFEHVLPWIGKIMLAYQDPDSTSGDQMLPQGTSFSKGYYRKQMN